jgi:hypothetical protein
LQHLRQDAVASYRYITHHPGHHDGDVNHPDAHDVVPWLAKQPLHPLSLADLVK